MSVSVKWKQNWPPGALQEMQFVVWHASEQEQDSLVRLAMMLMESFIGKVCWNGERKQIY